MSRSSRARDESTSGVLCGWRSAAGFTLLEIMLVLVVMTITAALVVPALIEPVGTELRTSAGSVAAGLRQARNEAVNGHRDVPFTVHLDRKEFVVGDASQRRAMPRSVDVSVFTARSELLGNRQAAIRFFPDGTSTGGRITLRQGERSYHVDVDWMTGQVRVRASSAAESAPDDALRSSVRLDS